jgi:hypothetical protein
MTQEVLELSRESLSASLFDVPEGYTLAKSMNELYGIPAAQQQPQVSTRRQTTPPASTNTTAPSTAKKPGVIRIGLITPKVEVSSGDASSMRETVRGSFMGQLNGQNVELVALSSQQLSQAVDEARTDRV